MIDSAGFADLRGYLKRRIACARFRVGSTYYTVPLSGIDILADGTVRARVSITGLGEITVNRVELLNSDNQVWAHEDVNIKISTGQNGILYWFDFTFTEKKKEE